MNIKKITCFKIGYFLFPIVVFLFELIFTHDDFSFALAFIVCLYLSFPLGIATGYTILYSFPINLEKIFFSLPFDRYTNQGIQIFILSCFLLSIGYTQWFIVLPKIWGFLRKIIKRDS